MNSQTGCRNSSQESTMLRTCGVSDLSLGERRNLSSLCACTFGPNLRLKIVISREKGFVASRFITTACKNMCGTNVVVNNQSHHSKKILLFADWLFTTLSMGYMGQLIWDIRQK